MKLLEQTAPNRNRPHAYHRYLKRAKVRVERRRAKLDPECQPAYRRFNGYET